VCFYLPLSANSKQEKASLFNTAAFRRQTYKLFFIELAKSSISIVQARVQQGGVQPVNGAPQNHLVGHIQQQRDEHSMFEVVTGRGHPRTADEVVLCAC